MNLYLAILIFFPQNYEFISCNSYLFLRIMNIDLAVLNFFLRIMSLYLAILIFFSLNYKFLSCSADFSSQFWLEKKLNVTFWHFSHFCELISCDSVAMTFFLFCLPVAETSFHRKQSSKEQMHLLSLLITFWIELCDAEL